MDCVAPAKLAPFLFGRNAPPKETSITPIIALSNRADFWGGGDKTEADEIDDLVQRFRDMGRVTAEQAIAEGQDITDTEPIVALVAEQVVKLAKKPVGAALLAQAAAAALFNETLAAYEERLQELHQRDASIGGSAA